LANILLESNEWETIWLMTSVVELEVVQYKALKKLDIVAGFTGVDFTVVGRSRAVLSSRRRFEIQRFKD
jgi:hypothetical protein